MTTGARLGALLIGLVLALGCGAERTSVGSAIGDRAVVGTGDAGTGDLTSVAERRRLEAIAAERARTPADGGYRIGADDLLEIHIPDLLEWSGRAPVPGPPSDGGAVIPRVAEAPVFVQGTRVNGVGDVTIPLLGTVRAAGLTPTGLEQEIGRRLVTAGILRNPQVSVQVAEHRSQVVAVIGSVERPGLYPLTRPGATIADLIWAAGGPNKDAGRLVAFVPVTASPGAAHAPPATGPVGRGEPIRLDLEKVLAAAGPESSILDPQVRPGDLINIAPAGTVHVDGWVGKPGSYPVTRALTVTGAVAAAGGHLFPADRRRVMVKRVLGPGDQRYLPVDLERVSQGQAPDVPIIDGDVVHLPGSIPRMLPYGAWAVVQTLVRVGGTVAIF